MTEREMEDLVWSYPDLLLNEPLTQHKRQQSSNVGRSDLIFRDKFGRLLVVELKKGAMPLALFRSSKIILVQSNASFRTPP